MGGDPGSRPPRRRRSRRARRSSYAGWRADVRVDRRYGWARVEFHCALSKDARARAHAAAPTRGAIRARRLLASWAGQVVARRAAAAVGARGLLAHRRQAAVARSIAERRREPSRYRGYAGGATVRTQARAKPRA